MAQIVERHLFGPGPSNPYPEAATALAQPLLGHLDPAFLALMDETCDRLRTVWGIDLGYARPDAVLLVLAALQDALDGTR